MQFWKTVWMLAVVGMVVAGCGNTDDSGSKCTADVDCGTGLQCDTATGQCVAKMDRNLACSKSTDCLEQEICHPTAKTCVQRCTASADCPSSAKTCAPLSTTDSTKVCQCSTDTLCNQDRDTASLVCSSLDKVCTPKCTSDAQCGRARMCNTATGQCEEDISLACAGDSDCLEAEICHPTAKVCVQTCTTSTDCPDSAKTCAQVSTADSRKVCQCSTDTLCNVYSDRQDLMCSTQDRVCMPKCTSDLDCSVGRTCDTATGRCKAAGGGGTGAACTGEGQSNCTYGTHFCSSNQCQALHAPSCVNYTNFQNKASLGTSGPILYSARMVSAATDTVYCSTATPKRIRVALSAYSSVPFPQTKNELSTFFYVKDDGSTVPGSFMVSATAGDYTVSGTNRERAAIILNLCVDAASTTRSMGFYFTNGNFLCFQANYQ